jgi:SAM-dependent methyltransferase
MLDKALRAALRQAYNNSVDYRRALALRDWREVERRAFLDQLHQAGAVSLLEIGAGPGPDSRFFRDQGLKLITSDLALENAFACREQGLLALVLDACAIPFAANRFDAVYSANCLLHLPKREFPLALAQAGRVLKPGGRFYLGQYGGPDQESVWEDDVYQPPRFFSFFSDEKLLGVVAKQFEIVNFKSIPLEEDTAALHFQSLTLRKAA